MEVVVEAQANGESGVSQNGNSINSGGAGTMGVVAVKACWAAKILTAAVA